MKKKNVLGGLMIGSLLISNIAFVKAEELSNSSQKVTVKNVDKSNYKFIDDTDTIIYSKNNPENIIVKIEVINDSFKSLEINNQTLSKECYTIKKEQNINIFELKSNCLTNYNEGNYNVTYNYNYGNISNNLKVINSSKESIIPKTVDNIFIYLTFSLLSLTTLIIVKKKI